MTLCSPRQNSSAITEQRALRAPEGARREFRRWGQAGAKPPKGAPERSARHEPGKTVQIRRRVPTTSARENHLGHVPVLLGAHLGVLWSGNVSMVGGGAEDGVR